MKLKPNFFLIVVLLFVTNFAQARDLRVATVAELTAAVPGLLPGDRLLLQDGSYKNIRLIVRQSGQAGRPIEIGAENSGKVFFEGDVAVELRGEHIVLKGIYFKEGSRDPKRWKSHGPGLIAIYGSFNRVTECMFNNFDEAHSAYITTSLTPEGKVPTHCRIDHCSFVNKLTFDQVINLNNNFKKDTLTGGPAMYHRVDHCFFSNPKKPGNAGGGIRIGYYRNDIGRCLIDSNIFIRQDSEPEIITGKSQENIYFGNTFLNCRGTLNFRHGDRQVALNNFFISTDTLFEYGGMFIWGSQHLIANNYFSLAKTIQSRGGAAIYLNPGTIASEHAKAFTIWILNNIFNNVKGYAIHFSPMMPQRLQFFPNLQASELLPQDIYIENNCFYSQNQMKHIFFTNEYPGETKNINWKNNAYFGAEAGLKGVKGLQKGKKHNHVFPLTQCVGSVASAKTATCTNFEGMNFDLNRPIADGIKGEPLQLERVLPTWMVTEVGSYHATGLLTPKLKQRLERITNKN